MIASVYARKSTEQRGADADAKSVARQIENARAFAAAKGWRVDDAHVYSDEAISGAETHKLVNRQRLLDVIATGHAPFQVLILRDLSRFSRRDGDVVLGELKGITRAGVEIWCYQDGAQQRFDSLGEDVVGFVTTSMNAEYRRSIARFTTEAMLRKAQAGHVTGGKCYGYTNERVHGHTERRINEAEADVVRRIFALKADGMGNKRIAKLLNDERIASPTGGTWSPTSLDAMLSRELYRGASVYNKTRKRGPDGARAGAARPEPDWVRVDQPELRIVREDIWRAVQARLATFPSSGRGKRRRRDADSAYLLSGHVRCSECGGAIGVLNRRTYGCLAYHRKGTSACRNGVRLSMATLDGAVLERLSGAVLRPAAVKAILDGVRAAFHTPTRARDQARARRDLTTVDQQIARLTDAIAAGEPMAPLLAAVKARQECRTTLAAEIAAEAEVDVTRLDWRKMEQRAQRRFAECRASLDGTVATTRQVLRTLFIRPLVLTPTARGYRFEGEAAMWRVLGEIGLPTNYGSGAGLGPALAVSRPSRATRRSHGSLPQHMARCGVRRDCRRELFHDIGLPAPQRAFWEARL